MTSCTYFCIQCFLFILFAKNSLSYVSAQSDLLCNFNGTDYDSNSDGNIIVNDGAHVNTLNPIEKVQNGMLSLTYEDLDSSRGAGGIAYYHESVRLKDPTRRKVASFNTSFTITQVTNGSSGDGMTFVISSNNTHHGEAGGSFWLYDPINTTEPTGIKTVAVEFDTYCNEGPPHYDINNNHVGLNPYSNYSSSRARDAAEAEIELYLSNVFTYVWVEYNSSTYLLEARVSPNNSRPADPFLNQTVDLFDLVDEYMWVGFSSGNGAVRSNFYVGRWTFESSGIPQSSPAPSVALPSSPVPSVPRPTSPAPQKSFAAKLNLLNGTAVGIPVALLLACIVIVVVSMQRGADGKRRYRQLWNPSSKEDSSMEILEGMPQRFSYKELSAATESFSEKSKLGQGGFGSVYRGVLRSSGIKVAVKKIKADSTQGQKEFMAEVLIISQLRHRNLIQLCGWCMDASRGKFVIVYELMPNGSLDKVLFPPAAEINMPCLSWSQRFKIVTGTAAALDYLHQGWTQQVIHRDVKSSNIMLDDEWNPKLGDFGLARLVDHQHAATTTLVAGTYGYIAPETAFLRRFTDKTDVFAFGAVLLEIASGRTAILHGAPEDEILLVDWVWKKFSENNLLSTVDRRLEGEYDAHWMEVLLMLGLLCSHPDPECRPGMRQVVQILAGDAEIPSIPTSKPDFVWRSTHVRLPSATSWDTCTGQVHDRASNMSSSDPSRGKGSGDNIVL